MSEIEKKWYVVRAVSGQEKRVKETIETEVAAAGLQDYVGQVLIPIEKVFQIRKGKKVSKEKKQNISTNMMNTKQNVLQRESRIYDAIR